MTDQRVGPSRSIDVAELAGVSRSTVSFIVNGRGDRFPEATRRRVLAAAAQLNYQPSTAGRTLVTGRSDLVVMLLPDVTFGSQLQDSIDRLTEEVSELGLTLVVRFSSPRLYETVRVVTALQADAVVDIGVLDEKSATALVDAGVRVISEVDPSVSASFNAAVGQAQVVEVVNSGPRVIVYAMLADGRSAPLGLRRAEGVDLESRRRDLGEAALVQVSLTRALAAESLSRMLALAEGRPLGVCCYNDEVAIAVLGAALDRGLRVPRDIAIIGVDATAVGQLITPQLSSIEVDAHLLTDHIVAELRSDSSESRASPSDADIHLIRGGTT